MNLTDLREVLDEHSDTEHAGLRAQTVLGGVHHRIRVRTRRRRVGAVAAATLAVLTVGVGALTVFRAPDEPLTVATTPMRTIEGFPEYANGARVIAAKSARPPARSVTVSFVATGADLTFFERCGINTRLEHTIELNGKRVVSGTGCNSTVESPFAMLADKYGLKVGATATVTMTLNGTPSREFGVAVGAAVDPAEYPYPPRPAVLTPLSLPHTPRIVRPDPTDPQRVVSTTFPWRDIDQMNVWSNTPGALTVRLNGVQVFTGEWWDYEVGQSGGPDSAELRALGLQLSPGQQVTMTVTPERMTGDWAVSLES